ncbi:MAG: metallophosphoesterase [Puniceicoccales bacterium]|jgi:predicted MPP superfamily phosphohydrolase|nr:metallophosphoesterase [Puniceicoccales bacterium]
MNLENTTPAVGKNGETRRSFLRKAGVLGTAGIIGASGAPLILRKLEAAAAPAAPSAAPLRFACISDTHIGHGKAAQFTARALQVLATKAPLDRLFVVGDITNSATNAEYDKLLAIFRDPANFPANIPVRFITGNHDYHSRRDPLAYYLHRVGQPHNEYTQIKGFPFISVGMTGSRTPIVYNKETREFLRKHLADAAAKFPGKPIFVFAHIPAPATCYGSRHWHAANHLDGIFDKYPQAILFSGHSHAPLTNHTSIWQGTFTAVNDGRITNNDNISADIEEGVTDRDGKPTNKPGRYDEISDGVVVSVLSTGDVEIQRWDVRRDVEILPRWIVAAPHDGSRFAYRANSPKPATPEFDVALPPVVKKTSGGLTLTIPQAQPALSVLRYQVDVFHGKPHGGSSGFVLSELETPAANSAANLVAKPLASRGPFSFYYLSSDQPKTVEAVFKKLPAVAPLYATIRAIDHYGKQSKRAWIGAL